MIIHIIRHTKPDIEPGICYGQTDLALASTFESESNRILEKLLDHYDAVYTSPLERCFRLSKKLNSDYYHNDDRLMEYNFGDWELTPWSDFRSNEAQSWLENFVTQPAPNGESMLTMQARVDDFWRDLLKSNHKAVAVVSHAGVQRLINAAIMEIPISNVFRLQLDYGAILEVHSDTSSGLITVKYI